MSQDQEHPSESTWRQHEIELAHFESAWRTGKTPSISEYLPERSCDERAYRLRELVIIDLECRCDRGQLARIEDYLERFPELGDCATLPSELIAEELRIKSKYGRVPSLDELKRRFPSRGDELQVLLERLPPRSKEKASAETVTGTLILGESIELQTNDVQGQTDVPTSAYLGRYALREQIGRGAFAVVHRAWDPELKREVAIKIPRAEYIDDEASSARMVREAQAAARLQHPGIVPIHEVGKDRRMYIVYELVDGPTLKDVLRDRVQTTLETVNWTKQIAEALHYAHQCGVVHRDIKPANIIFDAQGRPLLADFGLAQKKEDVGGTLTLEGDLLGTPAYMSPEQARGLGHHADARSDVYSLGVVLYQLLSGRIPFEGGSALILQRIQSEVPCLPNNIDRDLRTITLKCLEKEPAARYSSADALAHDLDRYLNGEPIHARPIGRSERLWKWSRRHPQLASLTVAVLLLGAVAVGAILQLRSTRTERDRAVKAELSAKLADQEKQRLLATSYASAGLLAMQRGRMRDALVYFDRSLAQGYSEPIRLRLNKVAAWVAIRDTAKAITEIDALSARDDLNDYEGEVLLWRAEFAFGRQLPATDVEQLLLSARDNELSPADNMYVQGMLAETSPDAVDLFKQVLDIDPFHHRARGMLVNVLFTLARMDEAHQQLAVSIQLFPEDQFFKLMDGLAWAVEGQMSESLAVLQRVSLTETEKEQWRDIFKQLNRILSQGVATDRPQQLVATLLRDKSSVQLLELLREISDKPYATGLQLPPRIHQKFADFAEIVRLIASASPEKTKFRENLEQIVDVHPEGALFYFLGEVQIAANELVAARDSFEESFRRPSLLGNHRHFALLGVAATSIYLAFGCEENIAENTQYAVKAIQRIDISEYVTPPNCRSFAITAITGRDFKLGRAWLEKWAATAGADQRDVLRNLIALEFLESDHVAALDACQQLLELDPQHPYALDHRAQALNAIKKQLPGDDDAEDAVKNHP